MIELYVCMDTWEEHSSNQILKLIYQASQTSHYIGRFLSQNSTPEKLKLCLIYLEFLPFYKDYSVE